MPLRDDLLNPIPGANPSGENLRYAPVYDKIKEARRQDDDGPMGEWQRERKVADWAQVIKLAGEALATKSKDFQLAAWLTEALLHKEGIQGLHAGVNLIRGLVENFWDTAYPELDDGDSEMRAAPLDWLGAHYLEVPIKRVPITKSGPQPARLPEGQEGRARSRPGRRLRQDGGVPGCRCSRRDHAGPVGQGVQRDFQGVLPDPRGEIEALLTTLEEFPTGRRGEVRRVRSVVQQTGLDF
jgi:type VI secretion system ImpA family protein